MKLDTNTRAFLLGFPLVIFAIYFFNKDQQTFGIIFSVLAVIVLVIGAFLIIKQKKKK